MGNALAGNLKFNVSWKSNIYWICRWEVSTVYENKYFKVSAGRSKNPDKLESNVRKAKEKLIENIGEWVNLKELEVQAQGWVSE